MEVMTLNIYTRDVWRARLPPLWDPDLRLPVGNVFCCYTSTYYCPDRRRCLTQVRKLQKFHIYNKSLRDIRYNFLLGGDGSIYEGRGWLYAAKIENDMTLNYNSIIIALIGVFKEDMAMTLNMVTRDQWGARNPKQTLPLSLPVKHVVCSRTMTQPCFSMQSCKHFVKRFQKYHQAVKKRLDIPYNFLVAPNGAVFEGRGWLNFTEVKYWFPKGNSVREGIHIALIGDYQGEPLPLPPAMIKAMKFLILFGIKNNYIAENYEFHLV